MTDEQVIKAFECCTKIEEGSKLELCFECPMFEEDVDDCTASLFRKVLDLIKRKHAEIERKGKILDSYALQYGTVTDQSKKIKEIKDEAYKEFAERLNKNFETYTDDEEKNALYMRNLINNLVKELTEGSNENRSD